ncbi:MAG TPA: TrkA family potassium uptake protein [Acidimicrobiales bacterium]|nr:TrkA family potassium uptake protein [Acidimicrobiales bacterium]
MKVAIAGAGNVGTSIASDLHEAGHEVLIIEQDTALVARLRHTIPVTWFEGDACEVSTLQRAGLADADVVVAATGDDEDNLVVSLLAKMEFAVPRVVARVNHPKNQWLFNETWGVDVSVSTPQMLTALVEEAVSVGTLVRILQLAQGEARLVEVTLADDSPAKGMSLVQMEMPRDATIVAVVRDQRVVVPHGDTVLYGGDEVIALVTEDSEGILKGLLVGGPALEAG